MTIKIGLTGSIGMGKSTTAGFFREAGVPVWDADEAVHRLYDRGGHAVPAIASVFPEAIEDGGVSRARLKEVISRDPAALKRIEEIVHPLVAADREIFIEVNAGAPMVLFDIPLLFETGANRWLDHIIVVTAPADVQRNRVMARGEMTEAQFDQILARQMPDAEKRARADTVIETVTMESAKSAVRNLIDRLSQDHA